MQETQFEGLYVDCLDNVRYSYSNLIYEVET